MPNFVVEQLLDSQGDRPDSCLAAGIGTVIDSCEQDPVLSVARHNPTISILNATLGNLSRALRSSQLAGQISSSSLPATAPNQVSLRSPALPAAEREHLVLMGSI